MRLIALIITLLALNGLFIGCQTTETDEEGWVEAGYIPPPDAPQEEEETVAAATPGSSVTPSTQPVDPARQVSSADTAKKPFKSGLTVFSKGCQMKKDADGGSEKVGFIKQGKKLWVDKHNDSWGKVYRKDGHAFVSLDCL